MKDDIPYIDLRDLSNQELEEVLCEVAHILEESFLENCKDIEIKIYANKFNRFSS